MPRGTWITWTPDLLERVAAVSGLDDVEALAEEIGISTASVYSIKSRLKAEGAEEILRKQKTRHENYRRGGSAKEPDTLTNQLVRIYNITVAQGGRGGATAQYGVTIPSRIGEIWVAKWGTQVRFRPTEDGLLIVPVEQEPLPPAPSWLPEVSSEESA